MENLFRGAATKRVFEGIVPVRAHDYQIRPPGFAVIDDRLGDRAGFGDSPKEGAALGGYSHWRKTFLLTHEEDSNFHIVHIEGFNQGEQSLKGVLRIGVGTHREENLLEGNLSVIFHKAIAVLGDEEGGDF